MLLHMASPGKKQPKRVARFLEAHEVIYGVRALERCPDTNLVTSVACLFCAAFGREDDPNPDQRKRARTRKYKYWGGPCFRTDNYKSHMVQQHPSVVEVVLGEVLLRPENWENEESAQILAPFESTIDRRDVKNRQQSVGTAEYRVVIRRVGRFYRVVTLLAAGLSFEQTAVICQPNEQLTSGTIDGDNVGHMARVVIGTNLQTLAMTLHKSWAFSLSLHSVDRRRSGERKPRLFLDVRVRVYWSGKIESFHLLSLPVAVSGSGTSGKVLFDTTSKVLNALNKQWLRKVIGCTVEMGGLAGSGASLEANVKAFGFMRRLEQQALAGLVRVSSARPPLDALLQRYFDSMLSADGAKWHLQLTALSAYLQRQQSAGNAEELSSASVPPCPRVSSVSWWNVVGTARWFDNARVPILRLLARTHASVVPLSWWISLKMALVVGTEAVKTREGLQGGYTTLSSQQPDRISTLRLGLAANMGIEGPLPEYQRTALREQSGLSDMIGSSDGAFGVKRQSVAIFVRGLGGWAAEIFEALSAEDRQKIIVTAARRMLELVQGLYCLAEELEVNGNSGNSNLSAFPPVLPKQLAGLHSVDFQEIIRVHRARLVESFSDAQLDMIETQHRELRTAAASEAADSFATGTKTQGT
ncbi:hypothetical protein BBO99_00007813 [Phytophthora kernoviae]|uniref:Uncharacterized protein n=1 Tax=Phytophthora kernoviae TaxID=325452 RepID=A0A3R7HT39_9STRA|nr:hypothetical protein BBI17_007591 [Phytophthora kernoviae]RLN76097.1 hypothetical protein BBO99_00007813 [Phytophthora kernoviae]